MSRVSPQRIVLADGSHLLHEMLRRILSKAKNMQVVEEIHDLRQLPEHIDDLGADWVVLSLPFNQDVPGWVDEYIAAHPYVGFLVVSSDSRRIRMKWSETHEEELDDPSLRDVMHILRRHPQEV
jgi:DNA-binding NarL/FixJ family response regulator